MYSCAWRPSSPVSRVSASACTMPTPQRWHGSIRITTACLRSWKRTPKKSPTVNPTSDASCLRPRTGFDRARWRRSLGQSSLQPLRFSQLVEEVPIDDSHHGYRQPVAELPLELGHMFEVHPVDA